jgi:prepilin-type processing-associated H-X9-DG protein
MYAQAHGGKYPDGLQCLLLVEGPWMMTSEVFCCPSSQDERATGATTREVADRLSQGGHLSYVYAGRGLATSAPATAVLAYDKPANHADAGTNFLYADGSVEFLPAEAAKRLVAEIEAGHNPPRRRGER